MASATERGEDWLAGLGRKPTMGEVGERDEQLADYFEYRFDPGDPAPHARLVIGPDTKGRLLEIGVIETSDEEGEAIVHANQLRAAWYHLALG
jgi:hypothetical protein